MSEFHYTKCQDITTQDIIDSYEKYKDNETDNGFIIDLDDLKECKYTSYLPIYIRLTSGEVVKPKKIKFINQGIDIGYGIPQPQDRSNKTIQISSYLKNASGAENINLLACYYYCQAIEATWNKHIEKKHIVKKGSKESKVPTITNEYGKKRPVHITNLDFKTFMSDEKKDKITGDWVKKDNPSFYFNIGKKFSKNIETLPILMDKDGNKLYYKDREGNISDKPIEIYEMDPTFYHANKCKYDSRSGKKIHELVGDIDEDGNTVLNNVNIQNYLVRNTSLFGSFRTDICISGVSAKLNAHISYANHIIQGESDGVYNDVDEDDLTKFMSLKGVKNSLDEPTSAIATNDDSDESSDEEDD